MHRSAVLAFAASALVTSIASATITGVAGDVQLIAAPADARLNVLTSSDWVRTWNESQNLTLSAGLIVDATSPGLYDQEADLGTFEIGAGAAISSHYVHFDSPGSTAAAATGAIRFADNIIAVVCRGDNGQNLTGRLDRSDYLGASTIYPDKVESRGLEFSSDWFRISADRKWIEFHFAIEAPGDYMRVITEVPAPGSAALAGIAALAGLARRRRA
ncbi:MAG: hypothetical protein IT434_16525 [Phycisphaerales bacterium]|jgi:hypothetical protein|nr:hypothetical protein [Phycisphaerales bacterium]